MNLTALQTNITAWVETLSGLEVEWGRLPQQWQELPFVLAYAGAIVPLGHDEPVYEYNTLTDRLDEKMIGVRRFTLRLSFRTEDQNLGLSARQFAENFRILTRSSASIETLNDACLGLWGTGELLDTDYVWSGRRVSQVDMDVLLGVRAELTDPSYSGSYIKSVHAEGSSYLLDEAGNPIEDNDGNPVVDNDVIDINVTTP